MLSLKKSLSHDEDEDFTKYIDLLDFIQDELLNSKNPRKYLIESVLLSLKAGQSAFEKKELQRLEQVVQQMFENSN